MAGEIGGLFPCRRLVAPDAEKVVVDLEGEPERPAEVAETTNDLLVVTRENRTRLDGSGDEGGGLAADHLKVVLNALHLCACTRGDVDELPLAEA